MKIPVVLIILTLFSCQNKLETKINPKKTTSVKQGALTKNQDSLFVLAKTDNENFVRITAPENSNFEFPDSSDEIELIKTGDFNADNKQDKMVNLGACGTGGCMIGVFLNQHDNYYTLAFMDYLKNPEYEIDKNGLWIIKSSEEIEPYNPSKLQISIFKIG